MIQMNANHPKNERKNDDEAKRVDDITFGVARESSLLTILYVWYTLEWALASAAFPPFRCS
jgi:hypothetical protein